MALLVHYPHMIGTGTTLYDYSGNGNDGTINNGTWKKNSYAGRYHLNYNNTNTNVSFGEFEKSSEGTIMFWARTDSGTSLSNAFCFQATNTVNTNAIYCILDYTSAGTAYFTARIGTTKKWEFSTTSVVFSQDTWTHFAITHNGTEPSVYINGELVALTYSTTTDKTVWFGDYSVNPQYNWIGSYYSTGNFYSGDMGEFQIYDEALTQTAIKQHMNNTYRN